MVPRGWWLAQNYPFIPACDPRLSYFSAPTFHRTSTLVGGVSRWRCWGTAVGLDHPCYVELALKPTPTDGLFQTSAGAAASNQVTFRHPSPRASAEPRAYGWWLAPAGAELGLARRGLWTSCRAGVAASGCNRLPSAVPTGIRPLPQGDRIGSLFIGQAPAVNIPPATRSPHGISSVGLRHRRTLVRGIS